MTGVQTCALPISLDCEDSSWMSRVLESQLKGLSSAAGNTAGKTASTRLASRSREVKDSGKQTVEGSDSDHEDSDGGGDGHSDEDLDFHVHYHGSSGGPNAHEASGSGGSAGPNARMLQVVAQRMQMWVQPCLQLPMCR